MGDHTLSDQRFLYRGYQWDDTLKMYHVRHRVYDPARMLWIQRDPLGRIPGANEYAYCLGEPVDLFDPMGLMSWSDVGTIAGEFVKGLTDGVVESVATGWHMAVDVALASSPVENAVKTLQMLGVDTGVVGEFYHGLDYIRQDAHDAIDAVKTSVQFDPTNPQLGNTRLASKMSYIILATAAGLPPEVAGADVALLAEQAASRIGLAGGRAAAADGALAGEVTAAEGTAAEVQVAADGSGGTSATGGCPSQPSGPTPPRATSPIRDLRAAGKADAHHVIQDAAVRDLPGYNSQLAPGIQLKGPSTTVGTPHYIATQVQRQAGGGTLGAEMGIGYKALRSAGYSEAEARQIIAEAADYFRSIGANPSTPTRIPGNRR